MRTNPIDDRAPFLALVFALALGVGASAAPAAAQSGDPLSALAPVLGELIAERNQRLTEREIRDRSIERGLGEAFAGGRVSPQGALRGALAYRSERRRLEELERRRRAERNRRIIEGLGRAFLSGR